MALTEAQSELRDLMSETSERLYFAGWMEGTEYRLWRFMNDPKDDGDWGIGKLPPSLRQELAVLSERIGGWIYFADEDDLPEEPRGERYAPLPVWLSMYETKTK